ncbi:hypothetical protein [Sphingomonas sp. MMS24-J13]|uniref:hypothetical protein n=1 Tax=Sphingomonas sp. MMS24-J13 TaxID=3238686 RepID=UPI00384B9A1A
MIHQRIEPPVGSDAAIASALEDAAPDIAELRAVTKRIADAQPGTPAYEGDQAYMAELVERIGARAARIDLANGTLTADDLLAIANERARDPRRAIEERRAALARAVAFATRQSAASQRALVEAQQAHHRNLQAEQAAWDAYRAIDNG